MMSISKPTFVIVPGAWYPSYAYETLADRLKAANFAVSIAAHPSLNSAQPSSTSPTQDAEEVQKVFLSLIEEEGKDIVLIAHSYGGVSGSGAAHGLSKATRAEAGKKGGVIGIVYIAAFLIPEGASMEGMLGNPPYCLKDQPLPGLCEASSPQELFFHDVDGQKANVKALSLQPQALGAFQKAAPPAAWQEPAFEGRLAYVRCTKDQALPAFVQDMLMEKSQAKWLVKDIEASHSPFMSRPEELTDLVMGFTDIFLSIGTPRSGTSKLF